MKIPFDKMFEGHWVITLLVMLISTVILACSSYNLFHLFQANFEYITMHGLLALQDDGAWQLFTLMINATLTTISYLMFRASEEVLLAKILKK